MNKRVLVILLVIMLGLLLTGCMPGNPRYTTEKPAGFFWGVWHGWIAPISLIVKLFNPAVLIYETANSGWWYDFGYYIAVAGGFGSFAFSRRRRRVSD